MNHQATSVNEARRTRYLIGAILLLATILRFAFIRHESLWFDELYNVWADNMSFTGMLKEQLAAGHPPLYYIVVRAWYSISTGETWVRSFSILAGVATVFFTYLAGRELFSRRAGLWAAALTALSPLLVMYSRANNFYSFMIALTVLSLWLLVRASIRGGWGNWLAYTAAAAAVAMSYFFGAVLVGAGWVFFWIVRSGQDKESEGAGANGKPAGSRDSATAAGLWPWITSQAILIVVIAGSYLLSKKAVSEPSRLALPDATHFWGWLCMLAVSPFILIAGRIDPSIFFSGAESTPVSHLVVLGAGLAAIMVGIVFSSTLRRSLLTRATIALLIYIILLISGPLLLQLVNGGVLSSRFYVWTAPAFMLLIGASIAAVPRRFGVVIGGLVLAVLLVFTVIEVSTNENGDADWRALMATIESNRQEGDMLVSYPIHSGQLAASYYLPKQLPIAGGMPAQSGDAIYFLKPGELWGGYYSGYLVGSGVEPALSGTDQRGRLVADFSGATRLWLVSETDLLSKFPEIRNVLSQDWVEVQRWDYEPQRLTLYERRPE